MQTKEPDVSTLKLYTSPRACSTACHIALEESDLDYEVEIIKIREGQHKTADYLAINPWGKIPALLIDDEVLTEAHAILSYIGEKSANSLLPEDNTLGRTRAHEWMNFLSSTVHIAFRPLFRPHFFLNKKSLYPKLLEVGVPILRNTLLEVDRRLAGREFALGKKFSVIDPYLFVFYMWGQRDDIAPHIADMANWKAHANRILERPATWKCLKREGVTKKNITNP